MTEHTFYIVFCTVPNQETADNIAGALVKDELAACVNIVPGLTSVYRWEGKICRDQETLLICKTTETAYRKLESKIKEIHPYDTPEIIAIPIIAGSKNIWIG